MYKKRVPGWKPSCILYLLFTFAKRPHCSYLRVMHPPSVPADRHIDTHFGLIFTYRPVLPVLQLLRTTFAFRHHTHFVRQFPNALAATTPAIRLLVLAPSSGFLYNPAANRFTLRHHGFFGGRLPRAHGYFQTATSNSKTLLRDPLRAASKPVSGIVHACPTSRILHRTLVSRPSFFIQNHSEPSPAELSVSTIIIP